MSYSDPGNWTTYDLDAFQAQLALRVDALGRGRLAGANHRQFVTAERARLASELGCSEEEVVAAFTEDELYAC